MNKNNKIDKKLKVLLVEDEEDIIFILAELMKHDVEFIGAQNLNVAIKKLEENQFDIIILDLNLPDSRGLETLKNILKKFPLMPIIILTGLDDESISTEVIKLGAQDYLTKGSLNKDIILRSIKYSIERKIIELNLKKSEQKYRSLFEGAKDAVFIADIETGIILDVNRQAELLLNKNKDQIIGMNHIEIHPKEEEIRARESFKKFLSYQGDIQRRPPTYYHVINSKNEKIPVEINASIITLPGNKKIIQGIFRDVTDRENYEEQLKQSQYMWKSLAENSFEYIVLADLNGKIQFANRDTYISREDVIGKSIYVNMPEEYKKDLEDCLDIVKNKKSIAKCYIEYTTSSGKQNFEFKITPLFVKKNKITGFIISSLNITRRKKFEETQREINEQLRLSEEKYRTLIENIQDGIFIISGSKMLFVNEAFAKMLDYEIDEVIGQDFRKFVAPEDIEMVTDRYKRRQAGENIPSEYEFRLLHKDGNIRSIVNMTVGLIKYNNQIASMGMVKDITERKRIEKELIQTNEQLKQSEQKYLSIILYSNDMIYSIDKDGYFTFINRKTDKVLGYKFEELRDERIKIFTLIPKEDVVNFKDIMSRIFLGSYMENYEITFLFRGEDREKRIFSTNSVPLYKKGTIVGMSSFGREITEQKKAEGKVIIAKQQLEKSNKELEQFAYIASHDLREPLRSISSFTELLVEKLKSKSELDSDTKDYIEYILEGSSRMREMIDDLLSLSRVNTRGKTFENYEITNVSEVIKQALFNLHILINQSEAKISVGDMPTIKADKAQLIVLFQNLIDNSIKFRKKDIIPQIEISAKKEFNRQIEKNEWIFSVKDNGIGIDAKNFHKLFVIFQRLHSREEYPGTGIGLAIAKKIVDRHNGRIWVESSVGNGSAFYFSIPI